jgi:hypothetical protein
VTAARSRITASTVSSRPARSSHMVAPFAVTDADGQSGSGSCSCCAVCQHAHCEASRRIYEARRAASKGSRRTDDRLEASTRFKKCVEVGDDLENLGCLGVKGV